MSISTHPLTRAVLVIATVTVLVVSATYAALQSQATLTGNTISSVSTALKISKNGVSFDSTQTGFSFDGIIPGGMEVPITGHPFWLRNDGAIDLDLSVSVVPSPTSSVTPSGSVDFTKMVLVFERLGVSSPVEFTVQALIDSYADGGLSLAEALQVDDDSELFTVKAKFLPDAFTGSSASVSDLDIEFVGTGIE